jgi:hypothetical protein
MASHLERHNKAMAHRQDVSVAFTASDLSVAPTEKLNAWTAKPCSFARHETRHNSFSVITCSDANSPRVIGYAGSLD